MKIKTPYFTINIEPLFLIVFFIFLMSIKIQKMLFYFYACYLFIIFHELSHMCIAAIFGKDVEEFKITMSGVCVLLKNDDNYSFYKKNYDRKKYIKEILIYFCGPLSNLFLALLFFNNKMIFEINIFFCIINLMPIFPLDGYNILYNFLSYININKHSGEIILGIVSRIFLLLLFLIGILQIFLAKNLSIVMFFSYLYMLKSKYNKNMKYDRFIHNLRC